MMEIGDLVAIRFDDDVALGMIMSPPNRVNQFEFVYVTRRCLVHDALPKSRFVQVRVSGGSFENLCDTDWNFIVGRTSEDCIKLRKWIAKADGKKD